MKETTMTMSCGLLRTFLWFFQAYATYGTLIVLQAAVPSMGLPYTGIMPAAIPVGVGHVMIAPVGLGTIALGGVVATPVGGGTAQKPHPVVITDDSGEKKVVGTSNPITGVVSLDADKLKDALGDTTANEPPPPPEDEAEEPPEEEDPPAEDPPEEEDPPAEDPPEEDPPEEDPPAEDPPEEDPPEEEDPPAEDPPEEEEPPEEEDSGEDPE